MTSFTQGLLGAGICAITFAAGIVVGDNRANASKASDVGQEIKVTFPEHVKLELEGLSSDRVACLEWVSKNFKDPNVGQLAMMCAGAKL